MQPYFPYIAPKEAGIHAKALQKLVEEIFASRFGVQQFMMLVDGRVLCEVDKVPYKRDSKRAMFSVSKSFTAMAIGIAQSEGLLALEDSVCSYFPEFLPSAPMENMREMKIKHLLTMTCGLDAAPHNFKRRRADDVIIDFPYMFEDYAAAGQIDWAKDFVRSYVARTPGQRFIYSNECSYMLSRVISKVTGASLLEYLQEKLFLPLNIEKPLWQACPNGAQVGGWGLWLSLEDLAKFAELLRCGGNWQGRQIVDATYIKEATCAQIDVPGAQNRPEREFGYQIWVLGGGKAYAGIGAFGQIYFVCPEYKISIVLAGGSVQYMKILHLLLKGLPKIFAATKNSEEEAKVQLSIAPEETPQGVSSWDMPVSARYSGVAYIFAENPLGIERLRFIFGAEDEIEVTIKGKIATMPIGYDRFAYGAMPVQEGQNTDPHFAPLFSKVASAGAWQDGAFAMKQVFYETPYVHEMCCVFTDHGITITNKRNVSFVQNLNTTLVGVREK